MRWSTSLDNCEVGTSLDNCEVDNGLCCKCGCVVPVLWGVGVVGIVVVGPTGMGEARNHLPTCSLPDTRQRIAS